MWIYAAPLDDAYLKAHLCGMTYELSNRELPQPETRVRAAGYAVTLLLIAGATMAGFFISSRWGTAAVALLYIPPVLVAAVTNGLGPALGAAVVSTLAYNYYFTAPYRTLLIHSPADIVTVIVLFLVATVTSHLAGSLRTQSRIATSHAARNATIAGLARRLLSCVSPEQIGKVAVSELASLFDANAVVVVAGTRPQLIAVSNEGTSLGPVDLAAAALTLQTGKPSRADERRVQLSDWLFHPIASDRATLAAIGLAREDGKPPVTREQSPLLVNLLDQVALALERARLEEEAREFVALRERDRLRTALLTSIGEDVKPRLNNIAAAARALRCAAGTDRILTATLASETAHLNRYVDGLVDLAPGEDREPLAIGPLTIDIQGRSVRRNGEVVHLTPKEYSVLLELAKHAGRVLTHAHLLRSVWGPAQEEHIDYLRVAIRALRQKLEQDPTRPELIINEPAIGYRLVPPEPS